jgi:ribosomal protein L37AE/L43A
VPHVIERAPTGRAKCRACGSAVAKGDWRIGEVVPNLYADAEGAQALHWYHPRCAAYRRPEAALQALAAAADGPDDRATLVAAAEHGVAHPRVVRVDAAGRAPSGRAACRHCRTPIAKGAWRIALLFWQDGRFAPAGFIHVACAGPYLETTAIVDRLRYFTPDLTDDDATALAAELDSPPPPVAPASSDA